MTTLQHLADRAFVLTVLAFALMMPPVLTIFTGPATIFGLPLLTVYCFAVWLAVIVAGWAVSRRLAMAERATATPTDPAKPAADDE